MNNHSKGNAITNGNKNINPSKKQEIKNISNQTTMRSLDRQRLHQILGHPGEQVLEYRQ